jgi:hypothetical protein
MVDKSTYVEYNEDTLETIIDSVANNACILFLGPLFGQTNDGKKINDLLFQELWKNNIKVDNDFQNLFIKKIDTPPQKIALRMKNFYNSTGDTVPPATGSTTFIYRNVAKINFNAVIVFGQDVFLKNAFDEEGFIYDFRYYSSKGPQPPVIRSGGKALNMGPAESIPIIYNVFGNYNDAQSLITDYGTYYKFLFAIMGDPSFFPADLNARIASAQVFLFLGFDLKKWYVPLLVTRFYNIGNTITKSMFASSMNDTDVSNNEEYVNWLGRYPLNLQPIGDTAAFLDSVVATPDGIQKGLLRAKDNPAMLVKSQYYEQPEFRQKKAEWLNQLGTEGAEAMQATFDDMIAFFGQTGFEESKIFILLKKASLCTAIEDKMENTITAELFDTYVARVRKDVIVYINR